MEKQGGKKGGWQRLMSICWLVQFACYSFLSGSAGPLQRRFLTVINRDSFHPPAEFSEGQLSMKEKMEGNICSKTVYRPPLSENIQLNISGMDLGRTWSLPIEKQLTACGSFSEGRASCCRKTGISGSLMDLFDRLLYFPFYAFVHSINMASLSLTHKHVCRCRSTCEESPVHN